MTYPEAKEKMLFIDKDIDLAYDNGIVWVFESSKNEGRIIGIPLCINKETGELGLMTDYFDKEGYTETVELDFETGEPKEKSKRDKREVW